MTLEQWRRRKKLTYQELADKLGFTINLTHRICKQNGLGSIKLHNAKKVMEVTDGLVGIKDLLHRCNEKDEA